MKILRFLIFFSIVFVFFRFIFVFRKINCLLEQAVIENGVCEKINDRFRGKSLFFTDLENDAIWDELMTSQEYGQVYQYQKISKSLSGQANLSLLSKLPDYRLIIGSESYLLNQSHKLKNNQEHLVLPSIEFKADSVLIAHGYLNEDYHQKFLALSTALRKYQITSTRIIWQSDQEIHLILQEIEVILDDLKEFDYQIERLSLILKQQEVQAILSDKKILDMRFNLPVLKNY